MLAAYIDNAQEWQLCRSWTALAVDAGIEVEACNKTIQLAMNDYDYYNRKAIRRQLKGPAIEKMRLDAWPHWKQLLRPGTIELLRFSDESHKGVPHECTHDIKRPVGARAKPQYIQYDKEDEKRPGKKGKKPPAEGLPDGDEDLRTQYKAECVHFWAAVGVGFKSELVFYDCGNSNGAMKSSYYIEQIIEAEIARWTGPFILVEDRAAGHGCHKEEPLGAQTFAEWDVAGKRRQINDVMQAKRRHRIKWVFLPSASPDFNVIETVWKWVKQKYQYSDFLPENKQAKMEELRRIWREEIDQSEIDALILGGRGNSKHLRKSLKSRWDDLAQSGGRPTGN